MLAALAGITVLLFSGTASAETCESGCEEARGPADPNLVESALHSVNGLVQEPVRALLAPGKRDAAVEPQGAAPTAGTPSDQATTQSGAPAPAVSASTPSSAPGPADATDEAVRQPAELASSALDETPAGHLAEPVVGAVTETVATAVPAALAAVSAPARDLLEGRPLPQVLGSATDAVAEVGAAVVPAAAATAQSLGATTQQLVATTQTTTTTVLGSAQHLVHTVTGSLTTAAVSAQETLFAALGGAAFTQMGTAVPQGPSAAGGDQFGAAAFGTAVPTVGIAGKTLGEVASTEPRSADVQVPTPPPDHATDETSAAGDQDAPVRASGYAAPVTAASGASATGSGGTSSPSSPELGKACFDLAPGAPQPGFVPPLRHSAYVPSAPVEEPAESPD